MAAVELHGSILSGGAEKRGRGIRCSFSPLFIRLKPWNQGRREAPPRLLLRARSSVMAVATAATTSRSKTTNRHSPLSFHPPCGLESYKMDEEEEAMTPLPLALSLPLPLPSSHEEEEDKKEEDKEMEGVTHERLDQWIRDSIGEIVRNIGEAPLLLHIFSLQGQPGTTTKCSLSSSSVRVEREVGPLANSWPDIKRRWHGGGGSHDCRHHPMPDGIVLIQELSSSRRKVEAQLHGDISGDGNQTWGLVVQGRGLDYASCYLLNTCRVRSSLGMCTHFCLVKAQCFGEPMDTQLNKAWLCR